MTITRKSYYCLEELIEDLSSKGYSDYKLNSLIDQAIANYSYTNKWYVDMAEVSFSAHIEVLKMKICQN